MILILGKPRKKAKSLYIKNKDYGLNLKTFCLVDKLSSES